MIFRRIRWLVIVCIVIVLAAMVQGLASAAPKGSKVQRYIVAVQSKADYGAIRAKAKSLGADVVSDIRQLRMMVIYASGSVRDELARDERIQGVGLDHIEKIATSPDAPLTPNLKAPGRLSAREVSVSGVKRPKTDGFTPDPAFFQQGTLWTLRRIEADKAWDTTTGDPDVVVGVADTGLDYTHADLADNVVDVVDFTLSEKPPLCATFFGTSDHALAHRLGVPDDLDFNGHGSWIGGNIAGVANGTGINGIAPHVSLVSLKISGWCGSAYDSTLINAFLYAANAGIDVVSISFGGYLDRSDPIQDLIWNKYVQVVDYAKSQGTVIVAAAGNEHTEIGADGLVLTHGSLTNPDSTLVDFFGQYEVPGGVPGVVDVSSTGRVNRPSKEVCPPGSEGSSTDLNATCKPTSDPHQAAGMGQQDQLAYYSNYGSRIDVAGPGGARKFNLPFWDRGGTPGFPYTGADGTNDFEDFSITSNYATSIPCFIIPSGFPFPEDQCYTAIQGTSMATPHASAALALIASAHPELRHDVDGLVSFLKEHARSATNSTEVLSATDLSDGDLTGTVCDQGYCHLGGGAVPNDEAYGAGIVDVSNIG